MGKATADYNFSAISNGLLCFITNRSLYVCFLPQNIIFAPFYVVKTIFERNERN